MKKITSLIASFLLMIGMNANAQGISAPALESGKLMTAEELSKTTGTKRIAIQLIHQLGDAKSSWYNAAKGGIPFYNLKANFSEGVVYEWIATEDGRHYLKLVENGQYVQNDRPTHLGVKSTAQKIRVVQPLVEGGQGELATNWDGSCPAKTDDYNRYVCRFIAADGNNQGKWINANNDSWNAGTGVWTMFYVYDLTGHVAFSDIQGTAISGLEAGSKIATFSAPFATTLPEGVKAYTVEMQTANTASVKMVPVEGTTVAANQGVILVSKLANAVLTPAEATTAATSSVLLNSAENEVTMGANDYVLAVNGGTTQFYKATAGTTLRVNKAYLNLPAAQAAALKLNFGGDVTAIEGVEADENANAPIFDLCGRRVNNTVKGGVYIQNGKKFIVK